MRQGQIALLFCLLLVPCFAYAEQPLSLEAGARITELQQRLDDSEKQRAILAQQLQDADSERESAQLARLRQDNQRLKMAIRESSKIGVETDQTKRNAMIKEAFEIVRSDYGYLPLHQQPMSWGVKDNIKVIQRADDVLDLRDVVLP